MQNGDARWFGTRLAKLNGKAVLAWQALDELGGDVNAMGMTFRDAY